MKHLIVYAKRPLPGYAKTRLAAGIGVEEAAGVYARLLYGYLLDLLHAGLKDTRIELAVASLEDVPFFAAAFPELLVRPQVVGDLGVRMAASFAQAFAAGAERAVLTGSDIPGLNGDIIQAAFTALENDPAVIGPAHDGGYYLLGLRAPGAPVFGGIAWSTGAVRAQTEALIRAAGLTLSYLPALTDLDTLEDYATWRGT
ncbi:MAG: TIGR04282 family arsenosugar biosynthesis glycosyltransferase [Anaerolineae bacterium]|nr:TIGR04282 family arsenosugar biosynthesis glycosyltransferase [Anaerolineae bacterium]